MQRVVNADTLEVKTKSQLIHLGGAGTRMVTVDNDGLISAQPIPSGGTGGGSMADPGSNGIVIRTALNVTLSRTIVGTANLITVTNGDGVAGNPTINVGANVATTTNTITLSNKTLSSNTKIQLTSPALGDLFYLNATSDMVKLGIGPTNYVLTSIGGVPTWAAPTGGGGTALSYMSADDFAGSNTGLDPIRLKNGNGFIDPGSNGIMIRTAANTLIPRVLTGTSGLITVTNGNGVSSNPTITVGSNVARRDVAQTLTGNQSVNGDVIILGGNGFQMVAPDGSVYKFTVSNGGTLSSTLMT